MQGIIKSKESHKVMPRFKAVEAHAEKESKYTPFKGSNFVRCVILVRNTPISHVTIIILEPVIKSSVSHLCDNSQLALWLWHVCRLSSW